MAPTFFLALRNRRRGHGRAVAAVRAREQGAAPPDPAAILRRPEAVSTAPVVEEETESDVESSFDNSGEDEAPEERVQGNSKVPKRDWVDWEDLILEDTVPLVGFVRMILHSGKYATFFFFSHPALFCRLPLEFTIMDSCVQTKLKCYCHLNVLLFGCPRSQTQFMKQMLCELNLYVVHETSMGITRPL
jgi:hypothetical protein